MLVNMDLLTSLLLFLISLAIVLSLSEPLLLVVTAHHHIRHLIVLIVGRLSRMNLLQLSDTLASILLPDLTNFSIGPLSNFNE